MIAVFNQPPSVKLCSPRNKALCRKRIVPSDHRAGVLRSARYIVRVIPFGFCCVHIRKGYRAVFHNRTLHLFSLLRVIGKLTAVYCDCVLQLICSVLPSVYIIRKRCGNRTAPCREQTGDIICSSVGGLPFVAWRCCFSFGIAQRIAAAVIFCIAYLLRRQKTRSCCNLWVNPFSED